VTPDLVILLCGGKRRMAQFHMRYPLSFSVSVRRPQMFHKVFFCTVIFIFAKRGRRLGWQIWWRVKLKDGSQHHLLLLIIAQGKDFYLIFHIPEIPLARLHFTPAHRHKCVCVFVCVRCHVCQGTRNDINLDFFRNEWLDSVKMLG
jgi:hypothetical protein